MASSHERNSWILEQIQLLKSQHTVGTKNLFSLVKFRAALQEISDEIEEGSCRRVSFSFLSNFAKNVEWWAKSTFEIHCRNLLIANFGTFKVLDPDDVGFCSFAPGSSRGELLDDKSAGKISERLFSVNYKDILLGLPKLLTLLDAEERESKSAVISEWLKDNLQLTDMSNASSFKFLDIDAYLLNSGSVWEEHDFLEQAKYSRLAWEDSECQELHSDSFCLVDDSLQEVPTDEQIYLSSLHYENEYSDSLRSTALICIMELIAEGKGCLISPEDAVLFDPRGLFDRALNEQVLGRFDTQKEIIIAFCNEFLSRSFDIYPRLLGDCTEEDLFGYTKIGLSKWIDGVIDNVEGKVSSAKKWVYNFQGFGIEVLVQGSESDLLYFDYIRRGLVEHRRFLIRYYSS